MKKGLIFFLFCLICEEAFAGIFTVVPTDKSQQYLGMVFGGSVGAISLGGGDNPVLSLMFERFNFIIVTIGAVVLSYIGVMTTINTAREGEAMGKKMSLWVPLRAFSGMLLMVPGPTSGYSVVQMTVMWIVLNGVGAANMVWDVVLEQLTRQVPAVGAINIQMTPVYLAPLSQSVLQASTCMYTINTYMPELAANAGPMQNKSVSIYTVTEAPTPAPSATATTQIIQKATVFVGVQGAPSPYDSLCGSFKIQSQLDKSNIKSTFNYSTAQQRLLIKIAALQNMFSVLDPAAQLLANDKASNTTVDPGYIYAAGKGYISQITQLATGVQAAPGSNAQSWETGANPVNPITGDYAKLKSYGWIHAGSYYFTMVRASGAKPDFETIPGQAQLPAAKGVPNTVALTGDALPAPNTTAWPPTNASGTSSLGVVLSPAAPNFQIRKMANAINRAYNYWNSDQSAQPPAVKGLANLPVSTGNDTLDAILNGMRTGMQQPILEYIETIADGSTAGGGTPDPLISIGQFGGILMLAAEISVFLSILTSVLITLAVAWGYCLDSVGSAFLTLFLTLIPMIYALAVMMWTLGATLGIYLPLIPYLVFTFTAFGWIIQVIEAVVAAPIIALGLIHPGGEELGKLGSALPILANIFLRPTLMIFGFVLGASLLRAGIALVNFGFVPAITEGAAISIFSILAVLGMYIAIITAIVNKSFSLIYVLPNQIMRWMGGTAETGDAEAMVEKAHGGFKGGAEQGQKGVSAGFEKGQSIGKEAKEKAAKGKGGGDLPK